MVGLCWGFVFETRFAGLGFPFGVKLPRFRCFVSALGFNVS